MSNFTYVVAALAVLYCLLLVGSVFYARSLAPLIRRRDLLSLGAGLAAFVVHALIFFSGAILFLALATYAAIFGLFWIVGAQTRTKSSA